MICLQSLFQEKDVKDNRYFFKRAYYVSVLKEVLETSNVCQAVTVAYLHGNRRKPILTVMPITSRCDCARPQNMADIASRQSRIRFLEATMRRESDTGIRLAGESFPRCQTSSRTRQHA